jgi:DNA mismatch repair protein MutS
MYTEYIKHWKHYSNIYGAQTALFMMVGKFYELYDILDKTTGEGQTNVKQAVEALGITLTTRKDEGPQKEDTYFAGFPEQSLQKFAAMLTRDGWTVVVCDQTKNEKGKVEGRPVARIFSPGTHIETAGGEAPYLAGVWMMETEFQAPVFAAAVLDLTTGKIVSYEGKAQGGSEMWSADDLVHFFQVHQPRETVFWWRGALITRPTEGTIRRRLGLQTGALHLELGNEKEQGSLENEVVRQSFLERKFAKQRCLLPFKQQLGAKGYIERVLVCILRFAEDHLPSATENIQGHHVWSPESSVYLGNNTLYQLNYLSSNQDQEQGVLNLFQRTLTGMGRRGMRERLLFPSANADYIRARLMEVQSMYDLETASQKTIESFLRLIHDIARLHRKIVMTTVEAIDILALDTSYGCIKKLIQRVESTPLRMEKEDILAFERYYDIFLESFDIEKAKAAMSSQDITFLPESKAPKTADYENQLLKLRESSVQMLEKCRLFFGLPENVLKLETTDSFCITATKTILTQVQRKLTSVPSAEHPYEHMRVDLKKSVKSSLIFPELERIHFQALGIRTKLAAAFREEIIQVCSDCMNPVWQILENWVAALDVNLTLAKVAKDRGYKRPEILDASSKAGVKITELRHPLLESIQTRTEYVKHNVSLGFEDADDEGWLLYGMNASGKSSLMKSIGISVLLAQAGSFVPATSFQLRPFKSILTRILNQDNLWAGMSSFAVEVSELRDIFQRADKKSLVLGDELCSGTESISATSLVAAGITYLHKVESRFVFATHLHGLHQIDDIRSLKKLGTWHLRVHYEAATDKLVYDRTLHRGPGGTLYGLEVARAMHLPHEILKAAMSYRRQILGEVSEESASPSAWNAAVFRKSCEICQNPIVRELEVHHIKPRLHADSQKKFQDGSSMNDIRNLIIVCQECHDKHHEGLIDIGPQKETSAGPERKVIIVEKATKKSKWTEEQMKTIDSYIRRYANLPLSRIVFELGEQEDIKITEASLRKIRLSLTT